MIQGQSSQDGSCSGNTVSTTNSTFAFYWVDSGSGSQQTVTNTYTATNGEQASATATFSIDAPSGVTVGPLPPNINAVVPPAGQLLSAAAVYPAPWTDGIAKVDYINPFLGDGVDRGLQTRENVGTTVMGLASKPKPHIFPPAEHTSGCKYFRVLFTSTKTFRAETLAR